MKTIIRKLTALCTVLVVSIVSLSFVNVSTNESLASTENRGTVLIIDELPFEPTDTEPTAPYSPGEMIEMGITDISALVPAVLSAYPSYNSSDLIQGSDGKWYPAGSNDPLNGWIIIDSAYRYYNNGTMLTGWQELPATNDIGAGYYWFYFNANGNMYTGWMYVSSSNTYLYLKPATGIMAESEWVFINSYWYYFDANGYMRRSWIYLSGDWYYLRPASSNGHPDGSMATGEQYIVNKDDSSAYRSYYFDINGVMQLWTYPLPHTMISGIDAAYYTPYYVTSRFAESRIINGVSNIHNGLDLRAGVPIDIISATSGTVVISQLTTAMGELVVVRSNITAPNGNPLYVRYMHMTERAVDQYDTISAGTYLGTTGNTGGVAAHFHMDVNSFGITTSAVTNTNGQNPAAFFYDLEWVNKWPHGSAYCGYQQ